MAGRSARKSAKIKAGGVRQSVTLPATLAAEVRRVAKERDLTISGALVSLAERGVQAEAEAQRNLEGAYHRFFGEKQTAVKNKAGKDLVRAIFGKDSIAEDSVR